MKYKEIKENEKIIKGYNGYLLPDNEKNKLFKIFHPKYTDVLAHHCTFHFPAYSNDPLPTGKDFKVVGYVDDESGLECLVISVDGSVYRHDGSIYHITWSLDKSKGRKPFESNALLKQNGYKPTDIINIVMIPKFFR